MVVHTRGFVKFLLEDTEDIEEKPACFRHTPSIGGLDYLVTDFQMLLDLLIKSLDDSIIYDHGKFDILFELAHSLYELLKSFHKRYISRVYNES